VKYYIDTEFDGHNGPLISLAVIPECKKSQNFYFLTFHSGDRIKDPWVRENVDPIVMDYPKNIRAITHMARDCFVGQALRSFLAGDINPHFVADSPVDIARIADIISTDEHGNWHSTGYESITFEVQNVDCYPTTLEGAVQHNSYWDAMALREKLNELS